MQLNKNKGIYFKIKFYLFYASCTISCVCVLFSKSFSWNSPSSSNTSLSFSSSITFIGYLLTLNFFLAWNNTLLKDISVVKCIVVITNTLKIQVFKISLCKIYFWQIQLNPAIQKEKFKKLKKLATQYNIFLSKKYKLFFLMAWFIHETWLILCL